jgi:putative component of membrane protein insertase Oxa1/YidC/SpoIIIJ protein YidD
MDSRRRVRLCTPFFAGGLDSLRATLLRESPAAFRRRSLFVSKTR